ARAEASQLTDSARHEADHVKAEARREGKELSDDARHQAEQLVTEAQREAKQLREQSRREAESRVASAEEASDQVLAEARSLNGGSTGSAWPSVNRGSGCCVTSRPLTVGCRQTSGSTPRAVRLRGSGSPSNGAP